MGVEGVGVQLKLNDIFRVRDILSRNTIPAVRRDDRERGTQETKEKEKEKKNMKT